MIKKHFSQFSCRGQFPDSSHIRSVGSLNCFNSLTLCWINLKVTAILSNLSKVSHFFMNAERTFLIFILQMSFLCHKLCQTHLESHQSATGHCQTDTVAPPQIHTIGYISIAVSDWPWFKKKKKSVQKLGVCTFSFWKKLILLFNKDALNWSKVNDFFFFFFF